MVDYKVQTQILHCKIKNILDKYKINPSTFLQSAHPNNKLAHTEILAVLADMVLDAEDKFGITKTNRDSLNSIYESNKADHAFLNIADFQIGQIIKTYLVDLYGHFYTLNHGNITFTNKEHFDLPSKNVRNTDNEANITYINKKMGKSAHDMSSELCLLLLPDGTTYYAPYDHLTLAYWLNANNVDLHNAIRVESTKKLGDFSFTSLYNYKFSTSSDMDELIPLTYEQCDVLGLVYGALKHGWIFMKPIARELKKTTGFGFGKNEVFDEGGIASKNLRRLHMSISDFDMGEYIRELRLSTNAHEDLFSKN
ncbi:MAG: hypothetical protein J6V40_02195 [Clostridia bacterium]|nr:hypothetical protein [Clostridia bacterium]